MESSGITAGGGEPVVERSGLSAAAGRAFARVRPALPILRVIAYMAAVGLVVYMGVRAAGEIDFADLSLWLLPFALLGVLAWWLLLATGWSILAKGHPNRADIGTWCRTQPLRYLPGGFWAPASRATVLHGKWLDRISTVAAENVIALCAALAIGGLALGISGAVYWLPLVLAVAAPAIGSRFVSDHSRLDPGRTHRALLNYLLAFAGYVVAAVFVQAAVSGFTAPFEVAGVAAIAWAAGLVVVIAPGGVGIRELAYVGLLSHVLPEAEAVAAAVALRGLTIVAELAVLLVVGAPENLGEALRTRLGPSALRARVAPAGAFLRRHAVFLGLFAAGAFMRVLTTLAYTPAIIYYDSVDYLNRASTLSPGTARPLGYSAFIRALPGDSLAAIPIAQHLLGLGIALMIYVLLVRLGVRRWAAALAAAPVLLDAYQLIFEEFILTESLFIFGLVFGATALLWKRRPGILLAALAGLAFGGVALVRANGIIAIAPAVLALVCLRWEGERGLLRAPVPAILPVAALLAGFLVPVAGYASWFNRVHGDYAITNQGSRFIYARVAPFADCKKFDVPAEERSLCPGQAVGHRPRLQGSTVNWYMWARFGDNRTPALKLPKGEPRQVLPGRFARRVIKAQPFDYVKAVTHDFLRGFYPIRTRQDDELPISRWHFQEEFPPFSKIAPYILRQHDDYPGRSRPGLARFLRGYQRYVFAWGPVLALGLIAGLLTVLGVGRARRSGLRSAALLFTGLALCVYGSTVAANTFTWRYQIVLVSLLPPAAALGLTALLRKPSPHPRRRADDALESPSGTPDPASGGDGRYPAPASRDRPAGVT